MRAHATVSLSVQSSSSDYSADVLNAVIGPEQAAAAVRAGIERRGDWWNGGGGGNVYMRPMKHAPHPVVTQNEPAALQTGSRAYAITGIGRRKRCGNNTHAPRTCKTAQLARPRPGLSSLRRSIPRLFLL
jgi:hypothetical protein